MLRGNPAPVGFAASVSGYLRTYVYRERQGSKTLAVLERLDRIDSCASLPVAVGDSDPRIRTLAASCAGSAWQPGREQLAVIHGAGHPQSGETGKLTPDDFLNALAHAATLDVAADHAREIGRVKKGGEAPAHFDAILQHERLRSEAAERCNRELEQQVEGLRQEYISLKARYRDLRAVLDGEQPAAPAAAPEPQERKLPEGVRQRGAGFQAFWKVDGKQHHKGGFERAEQAADYRRQQLEQAERQKVASEAQGRRYEPDLTPEQISAMREQATA